MCDGIKDFPLVLQWIHDKNARREKLKEKTTFNNILLATVYPLFAITGKLTLVLEWKDYNHVEKQSVPIFIFPPFYHQSHFRFLKKKSIITKNYTAFRLWIWTQMKCIYIYINFFRNRELFYIKLIQEWKIKTLNKICNYIVDIFFR